MFLIFRKIDARLDMLPWRTVAGPVLLIGIGIGLTLSSVFPH